MKHKIVRWIWLHSHPCCKKKGHVKSGQGIFPANTHLPPLIECPLPLLYLSTEKPPSDTNGSLTSTLLAVSVTNLVRVKAVGI